MKTQSSLSQIVMLVLISTTFLVSQEPMDQGPSDILIETGRIHFLNPGKSVFVGDGSGMNIIDWKSIKCNTGVGHHALFKTTKGSFNTALGGYALSSNVSGSYNTALGCRAALISDEFFNTLLGYAVFGEVSDISMRNTAIGYRALFGDHGDQAKVYVTNTVIGNEALHGTRPPLGGSSISDNTAIGKQASYACIADGNTIIGTQALFYPEHSANNTAIGRAALLGINPTGDSEIWYHIGTGVGQNTLIESENSTGVGDSSLMKSMDGSAFGFKALSNKKTRSGTAAGHQALSKEDTSSSSARSGALTALGWMAGNNVEDIVDNATAVGALVGLTADHQVRIGNVAVSSIGGPVAWTAFSDAQFKKDIQEDVVGLSFINALRPVTYLVDRGELKSWWEKNYPNYPIETLDQLYDTTEVRFTGFIAQEVEAAAQNVGYEFSGVDAPKNGKDYYGLRYGTFTVPLIQAVQEITEQNQILEDRKEELIQEIKRLKSENERLSQQSLPRLAENESLQVRLEEIEQNFVKATTKTQKVKGKLEMSRPKK